MEVPQWFLVRDKTLAYFGVLWIVTVISGKWQEHVSGDCGEACHLQRASLYTGRPTLPIHSTFDQCSW